MEVAAAGRVGRDLAVRVEADLLGAGRQRLEDDLELLLGALAEHQPPADARDREVEARAGRGRGHVLGRPLRAEDQPVEVRAHQLAVRSRRHVADEDQRLRRLVDGEHAAHHAVGRVAMRADLQREQQRAARQLRGALSEVLLVEGEGGATVELVDHVALAAGHHALGPERVPAALGAVADPHVIAVQADGDHGIGEELAARDHERAAEPVAIPGEPAGDHHLRRQHRREPADQPRAVDVVAAREHDHAAEIRGGELGPEGDATRERVRGAAQGDAARADARVVEPDHRAGERLVVEVRAVDLAGRAAADQGGSREGRGELGERRRGGAERGCREHQHQRVPAVERRQGRRPLTVRVPDPSELHGPLRFPTYRGGRGQRLWGHQKLRRPPWSGIERHEITEVCAQRLDADRVDG